MYAAKNRENDRLKPSELPMVLKQIIPLLQVRVVAQDQAQELRSHPNLQSVKQDPAIIEAMIVYAKDMLGKNLDPAPLNDSPVFLFDEVIDVVKLFTKE